MGQIFHGSAKITRRSTRKLGNNVKTVAKWRRRDTVEDTPMGLKQIRSTGLIIKEEAAIVAFHRHTTPCCLWKIACWPCCRASRN